MLKHADIWRAIDALARVNDLSASGLARKAGLDPTTFNRSKRAAPDGRQRWPSTESVAKILDATGCSLGDFVALVGEGQDVQTLRRVPVIGYAQAGAAGFFTLRAVEPRGEFAGGLSGRAQGQATGEVLEEQHT